MKPFEFPEWGVYISLHATSGAYGQRNWEVFKDLDGQARQCRWSTESLAVVHLVKMICRVGGGKALAAACARSKTCPIPLVGGSCPVGARKENVAAPRRQQCVERGLGEDSLQQECRSPSISH